jgi:hypothetical protein
MDQVVAIEKRRRNLRIVLFAIILATLPCYCAGFLLWLTAPQQRGAQQLPASSATATFTPLANSQATNTPFVVITPLPLTVTAFSPLQPTPGQFFPPAVTRFLSPTPFIFPTLTLAPTLTALPTFTPLPTIAPATATVFIPPTDVPPLPTNTPEPVLPFPSDTPLPPVEVTTGP